MAYPSPYSTLWNHQTRLFHEIDQVRYQIQEAERQLSHAQQTLEIPGVKRYDRRKAKWIANTQYRQLRTLDHELQSLLHALFLCQAGIARAHAEASWGVTTYNQALEDYADPWDEEYKEDTQGHLFSPQRPQSPDSGFAEPALYGQPFDLDMTDDTSSHVFSHELQHPLPPINTQIQASTCPAAGSLSAKAEVFTPSLFTTNPFSKPTFSPLAPEFSPNPFAKANPSDPQYPLNATFLFRQPVWNDVEGDGVRKDVTPISPTATTGLGGDKTKRRYSVAAIELIESRLKHKRESEGGGAAKKAKI